MKVGRLKRPETRIDVGWLPSLNIKAFGKGNLYPQELRDIVLSSPAGAICVSRKAAFIEGNGISSRALSEAACNPAGELVDDIHSLVCADLAMYDGFALHVNYNVLGEIVSLCHIPFECCRLEEDDDMGNVAHIAYHPDWTGRRLTRNGKQIQVTRTNVVYFPVFNPLPEVVQAQIAAAGGIEAYRGQVLYATLKGANRYCVPQHDSAATQMSADEGVANVAYRNVRNSFLPAGMVVTRRGSSFPQGGDGRSDGGSPDDGFFDSVATLQGDVNAGKLLVIETDTDEERPEFVPFTANNYDRSFEVTAKSATEAIYAAFGQEQYYRLRSGSLGFSGEIAEDAKRDYAEFVTKHQRLLSRVYGRIFDRWSKSEPLPYYGTQDVAVEPLIASVTTPAQGTGDVI